VFDSKEKYNPVSPSVSEPTVGKENEVFHGFQQDYQMKLENIAKDKIRKLYKPNIPQSMGKTIKKSYLDGETSNATRQSNHLP